MRVTYKMRGLDKFLKQVQRKPKQLERAVDQELARSSLRVEHNAKTLAPWDTGWMSNSIYADKEAMLRYSVTSPVYYSVFVEQGTRYQSAQPFFFISLEDDYPVLMRNLRKIVQG